MSQWLFDHLYLLLVLCAAAAVGIWVYAALGRHGVPDTTKRRRKVPSKAEEHQGYSIQLKRPRDRDAQRYKSVRWINLVLTILVVVGGPAALGWYLGSLLWYIAARAGLIAGFIVGGWLLSKFVHRLFVYNPEWQAYVTNNAFTGRNIPYGPGLHPALEWEERNKSGNYSLEIITKPYTIAVQTKTAQVTAMGIFQYAVDLSRINNFIGVDVSTVEQGFVAFIESFLTKNLATYTAEEARTKIGETNKKLAEGFISAIRGKEQPIDFERRYGIHTVSVIVQSLKLPEAVQRTRDAKDEAHALREVVGELYGMEDQVLSNKLTKGKIGRDEYHKMLNRAMATSQNADMRFNVFEADVPATIAQAFKRFMGGSKPANDA